MARSGIRQYLRKQRQENRLAELTPEQRGAHPDAVRNFIVFGGSLADRIAEATKNSMGSRRAARAKRRWQMLEIERQEKKEQAEIQRKRDEESFTHRMQAKAQKMAARAQRAIMRKGVA